MTNHEEKLRAIAQRLESRAAAVIELGATAPSADLAARVAQAIEAGDALGRDLGDVRRLIEADRARLAQLQSGLMAGIGSSRDPHIEVHG